MSGEEAEEEVFDAIVIGGGVAGTVCAHQLARAFARGVSHYLSCCFASNTNMKTCHWETRSS